MAIPSGNGWRATTSTSWVLRPMRGEPSRPRAASTRPGVASTGCTSTRRPTSDRISGSTRAQAFRSEQRHHQQPGGKPAGDRRLRRLDCLAARPRLQPVERAPRDSAGDRPASCTRHPERSAGGGESAGFDTGASSGYGFASPIAPDGTGAFARATSRVLKINPVTLDLVWSYTNPRFFSTNISSAQRLPNGNTLVTAGAGGCIFEVTREGIIVWEYMYPLFSGANASNAVYRAYRVPYGWNDDEPGHPGRRRLRPAARVDHHSGRGVRPAVRAGRGVVRRVGRGRCGAGGSADRGAGRSLGR